ncbi:MAG: fasciclin domain-containing protein [Fimbriimonadia bacterium]|nr:fasciclin domain-containing protein [Fimbriimonadia bacterium]
MKRMMSMMAVGALALSLSMGYAFAPEKKDIVDTAIGAGQFKTLVSLVQAAGLVDALRSDGPFTVFAPTDAAFAKVPKATLDALGKDKEALKQVLLYHVVSGKVTSGQVVKVNKAKTLQGSDVKVKVSGKNVMINNAKVVKADIECTNGVIHVIDTVILPPAKK